MSSWGTPPAWAAVAVIGITALTVAQVCTLHRLSALRALRKDEVEQARRSIYWRVYADVLEDLAGGDMIGDTSLPLNGKE